MSVYRGKRQKTYRYKFRYAGRWHRGNTYQEREGDARLVEAKKKLELRQRRGGIAPPAPAPSFTEWAGVYYGWVTKRRRPPVRRPERIDELLRVVLRFWGARPADPASRRHAQPGEEAPFHDLTLQDPIDDASWILEWEEWMDRRGIAGGTRNHYNTVLSRLYYVALLPEYRHLAGVLQNPFAGRPRDRRVTRKVALTPALVLQWLAAMSYHARLAVSIAALAPKFRLKNILELEWGEHIAPDWTTITVWNHKTVDHTGAPLVSPISAQLRAILQDARARHPRQARVITYRGKPVASIRGAIRAAALDVGIPYGRYAPGGVTFHTMRHTAATVLARLKVNPWLGRDVIGQDKLETTEGYTHLELEEQRPVLEQLSDAFPIASTVMRLDRRARRLRAASDAGAPAGAIGEKAREMANVPARARRSPGRPFARKGE